MSEEIKIGNMVQTQKSVKVRIEVFPRGYVYDIQYNKISKKHEAYFRSRYGTYCIEVDKLNNLSFDELINSL